MANRDEVEEFLRRAAARRAAAQQQQRPAAPAPPQQQRPPAAPPAWSQPPRPAPPPPAPTLQPRRPATLADVVILQPVETVEAQVVDAELADQQDRLGRYVAQDLRGTEEIAERTRHLGEEVDLADDKLEAHLHQVFDHSVGQLKKQATDSVPKPPEGPRDQIPALTSAGIAQMMRSPEAIRNAIILGEILHRPEERW